MDEVRKENRENVAVFIDRADDSLTGQGSDETPTFQDLVISESYDWRRAFVNVGGAVSYAILDLADAIRDSGTE